jgi:beta-lactamase class D
MRYLIYSFLSLSILATYSCREARIDEHQDWANYFKEENVEGAFEYIDNNKERVHFYNKEFNSKQIIPGASFTLFECIVALESAVAPTEDYILPWNGNYYKFQHGKVEIISDTNDVHYQSNWSKDLTLTTAFQNHAIPHFQTLSSKITEDEMQHFIDTFKYGNRQIGNDKINFWNNGSLLISPDEQVGMIKRLYHGEMRGFTERSQRIAKGFFNKENKEDYSISYQRFEINHNDTFVVQYLGYVEKIKKLKNPKTNEIDAIPHPYFFVLSVYDAKDKDALPAKAEKIFRKILKETDLKEAFDNL